MNVDESVRDLLSFSTDIRSVAVLDAAGEVVAAAPGAAPAGLHASAERLWEAAGSCAAGKGGAGLEYVVVQDGAGAVGMLQESGRRIVAVTGPRPAVGLLLFDLRTCLTNASPEGDVR